MYCSFCGRKLPKDEGCTCCRAVSARNENPYYRDRKSLFQTGTPEEFDHAHNVTYKTDSFGKFDSCEYGGEDYHTRPESYQSFSNNPLAPSNSQATNSINTGNNQNVGCGLMITSFIIFIVFILAILGF